MVDHHEPADSPVEQGGMEIRLLKAGRKPRAQRG
jgi:hypothetical protein